MKRTMLSVIFLLISCSLYAADDYAAVLHMASYHPSARNYNEVNPGIGVRKTKKDQTKQDAFLSFGGYKNSLGKVSVYAGGGMHLHRIKAVDFTVVAGLVSGYQVLIAPFVMPEVGINFGAAKFGLPWSPVDNKLGFFEVAFWFPKDVTNYGGIFALFPGFFACHASF